MPETSDRRLDWVDAAKGLCIIMVVLFHATAGVEKQLDVLTWLNPVIEWARPFRMPDFFLISGLFLSARIGRPWRSYADTRIVHFAYFYVLWFHIHFLVRLGVLVHEVGAAGAAQQYLEGYVLPFGSLWFIYMLALYGIVARLVRDVPKAAVLAVAVLMHVLAPKSGVFIVDEFMDRFVFFFAGYAGAGHVFDIARRLAALRPMQLAAGLVVWGVAEAVAVGSGASHWPLVDLAVSSAGIVAVIAFSVLVVLPSRAATLRRRIGVALLVCGRNSLAVYLAFSLFMAATRVVLIKLVPGLDSGTIALAATVTGVTGSLVLQALVRGTWLGFLFERPAWARLSSANRSVAQRAAPLAAG